MGKRGKKSREPRDASGRLHTSAHLQVLGLGTDVGAGAAPSVLLFFDRARFIFNAGEGFQRFCAEHRIKITRVAGVLATRSTADAIGGLPGLVLMGSDVIRQGGDITAGPVSQDGRSKLSVLGPRRLVAHLEAVRGMLQSRSLQVEASDIEPEVGRGECEAPAGTLAENLIENEFMTVDAVLVHPRAAGDAEAKRGAPDDAAERPAKRPRTDFPREGRASFQDLEEMHGNYNPTPAVCYVCKLRPAPGKFLTQRAVELGVPAGPERALLVKGESITLADGRVIAPADCMTPDVQGPVAMIVDCPSVDHVDSLVSAPAWEPYIQQQEGGTAAEQTTTTSNGGPVVDRVASVVHIAPPHVVADARYAAWAARLAPKAKHIYANASATRGAPVHAVSARISAQLCELRPQVFHKQRHYEGAPPATGSGDRPGHFPGFNLRRVHLKPAERVGEIDDADVADDDKNIVQPCSPDRVPPEDVPRDDQVPQGLEPLPPALARLGRQELEVTLLGTGAALPSAHRNVTSILVDRFERGCLLLDCGEDTTGQLMRRFGARRTYELLRNLKCIWISHIHADHHLGIAGLLQARARALGPEAESAPLLPVVAPPALRGFMRGYARAGPCGIMFVPQKSLEVRPQPDADVEAMSGQEGWDATGGVALDGGQGRFSSGGVVHSREVCVPDVIREVMAQLELRRLDSVRVLHCAHAFAAVIEGNAGWKFVFSGDTGYPCDQLAAAARGATLLVHEATFEDELVDEARFKRHSTFGDALGCAAAANAYRVLLTHFSQRYPKMPQVHGQLEGRVCAAYDLMSVNLQDLPALPSLLPGLLEVIGTASNDDEDRIPTAMMSLGE